MIFIEIYKYFVELSVDWSLLNAIISNIIYNHSSDLISGRSVFAKFDSDMARNLIEFSIWILLYSPKSKYSFGAILSFFSQIANIFGPQAEFMLNQNISKICKISISILDYKNLVSLQGFCLKSKNPLNYEGIFQIYVFLVDI